MVSLPNRSCTKIEIRRIGWDNAICNHHYIKLFIYSFAFLLKVGSYMAEFTCLYNDLTDNSFANFSSFLTKSLAFLMMFCSSKMN